MTRGIKHEIERFINDLQAQYYPYKAGKEKYFVQLAVRPIQLWELAFPKDALFNVMNTVFPNGTNVRWQFKMPLNSMRLALGAKKVPKLKPEEMKRIVYFNNIAVYPIGIREDKKNKLDAHEEL